MAFNSGFPFDDDKAQHEALVNEVDEREDKISTVSLIWKPAVLAFIPITLTFVSIYLGFSWTRFFKHYLGTKEWLYPNYYNQENRLWACLPNGSATPQQLDDYFIISVWDTSQFLDITLAFGSFNFEVAKGIDVAWDVIIGRGGQIVLALLSYRILGAVLLQSMETRPASFKTYAAIGLDRGPVFTIWASLRDIWMRQTHGTGILVIITFASLYLLAFQTFVSTMTGYKPISTPLVHLDSDALYPAQDILQMTVFIKDGSRIGLTDDFPVAYTGPEDENFCTKCTPFEYRLSKDWWNYVVSAPVDPDVPSTFMLNEVNVSLPAPRLTTVNAAGLWMYNNKSYTVDDLRPICQPGNKYQWGFSFYVLLTFCIVTNLYAIAMYSLWLKTFLHSRKHRAGQKIGFFRAALDFADALKIQAGDDCTSKSEKELSDLVDRRGLGIVCTNVDELPPPRARRRRK